MKVVLMGLEFSLSNLGCDALSYSFVSELYSIAKEKGEDIEVSTIVFADQEVPYIPNTDIAIKCIGIHYKSKDFWRTIKKEFKNSDIIVDFTMGDSFADIYGVKRFVLDALIKTAAIKSGTPYVLGPQTYGPYKNPFVKAWAKWIMKKASMVYTRDEKSQRVAQDITGREVFLTTDVAFALPYNKQNLELEDKVKIGINPSGLLWVGGYTHDNQFGLSIDYQKYIWDLCEYLNNDSKYDVYLIPHVGTTDDNDDGDENDLAVCKKIQAKYPRMKVISNIKTPMEIKGYIAGLDVFIGARMHATIGAFSSGVATIPVSYSRKFEGLYGSLNYDYVIHALTYTNEEALNKTIEYINNRNELLNSVNNSMVEVNKKRNVFKQSFSDYLSKLK